MTQMYARVGDPVARRLGIAEPIQQWYERQVRRLLPGQTTVQLGGTECQFHVANRFEYANLRTIERPPERPVIRDLLSRLRPSDVFWDVGANIGVYTCFAGTRIREGHVLAIEPLPRNVDRIMANLELNGRRATVRKCALGAGSDTRMLQVSGPDVSGTFGRVRPETSSSSESAGTEAVETELISGDRLAEREGLRPTVIKIDVQGAELEVLRGLERTLRTEDCRLVYVNVYEKHIDEAGETSEVPSVLRDAGFRTERLSGWSGGYFLRAQS